uniref:Uncharacterized protein n=1 Tax=Anguilla anguilla TaxID=7936 RepID=A0A0E9T7T2_ANGAN
MRTSPLSQRLVSNHSLIQF